MAPISDAQPCRSPATSCCWSTVRRLRRARPATSLKISPTQTLHLLDTARRRGLGSPRAIGVAVPGPLERAHRHRDAGAARRRVARIPAAHQARSADRPQGRRRQRRQRVGARRILARCGARTSRRRAADARHRSRRRTDRRRQAGPRPQRNGRRVGPRDRQSGTARHATAARTDASNRMRRRRDCAAWSRSASAAARRRRCQRKSSMPTEISRCADCPPQARRGDQLALEAFATAGHYLGIAIASFINTFNPELVVIGGGVAGALPYMRKTMTAQVRERAFTAIAAQTPGSCAPPSVRAAASLARPTPRCIRSPVRSSICYILDPELNLIDTRVVRRQRGPHERATVQVDFLKTCPRGDVYRRRMRTCVCAIRLQREHDSAVIAALASRCVRSPSANRDAATSPPTNRRPSPSSRIIPRISFRTRFAPVTRSARIAQMFGVTADELAHANRIHVDDELQVDEVLKVPHPFTTEVNNAQVAGRNAERAAAGGGAEGRLG